MNFHAHSSNSKHAAHFFRQLCMFYMVLVEHFILTTRFLQKCFKVPETLEFEDAQIGHGV